MGTATCSKCGGSFSYNSSRFSGVPSNCGSCQDVRHPGWRSTGTPIYSPSPPATRRSTNLSSGSVADRTASAVCQHCHEGFSYDPSKFSSKPTNCASCMDKRDPNWRTRGTAIYTP
ncbi:hypothetical protein HQ571_00250 [Candidatus Kuenenbacteria bacterium]|nr:hypothetical protein [Candidatus Kuenenbacteria bacterium]